MISYETYKAHYFEGARKIAVRSFYPNTGRSKSIDKFLIKSFGNYDLFFDEKGELQSSIHIEESKKYKIIYTHNSNGRLLKAKQLNSKTDELEESCEYTYDRKGRIQTINNLYYYSCLNSKSLTRYIHTYRTRTEIVSMKGDEGEYKFYYYSDENGREIEFKSFENGVLHEWEIMEYDNTGNLSRILKLDNKGEIYGAYEYLNNYIGLNLGYRYTSLDRNYLREYTYELNEKGHWIKEIIKDDGYVRNIIFRTIEYY